MGIVSKICTAVLRPRWVVDDEGDPGIALGRGPFRIVIGYYKWSDTFTIYRASKLAHREAKKRELRVLRPDGAAATPPRFVQRKTDGPGPGD